MEINVTLVSESPVIDVDVIGSGPPGKTPVKGVDYWTEDEKEEIISEVLDRVPSGGGGGGTDYKIGHGLKITGGNTLEVDVTNNVEQDNTLPITASAVYSTVGNIEILLETI